MHNFPKLVRDRIPELIKERGATPRIQLLSTRDLYPWLIRKLREECLEFEETPSVEELADVLEVLVALASSIGITFEDVEMERRRKLSERGGFQKGILLEGIDESN
jgi:predicted house-cleaning noncanonical NTP pyrophosphatase (MazG superfamily)